MEQDYSMYMTETEYFANNPAATVVALALVVLMIAALWKMFQKAKQPGWAALIPFYNTYLLYKISFGNGWWFLLTLVPVANLVISIIMSFKLAKAYGKGVGFGFGNLFLPIIFYPILGFGKTKYKGVPKK